MKRDIVTAVIYYYIMTEFHYAKCDSRLSAYGGVGIKVSYFCYKNTCIKILAKICTARDQHVPPFFVHASRLNANGSKHLRLSFTIFFGVSSI